MTVVTHYDTLKVTPDAPPEVIQAAYKALAQKYHPDKNLNNPEAVRMMQMVIASYKVLADDKKRAEHDEWVKKQLPQPPKRVLTPQEKAAEEKAAMYAETAAKWAGWAVATAGEAKTAREKAAQAATKAAHCPPSEKTKWDAWANQANADAEEAEKKAASAAATAKQSADEAAKYAVPSKDGQLVTLYDTLKITRDAPPEVLQAACRAMSPKAASDPAIAKAIEHLSDAQKKAAHDAWIREKDPTAAAPAARKTTAEELEARARADKASNEAKALTAVADQADEKAVEAERKFREAAETAKAKAATKDGPAWKIWAEKAQKEAEQERTRAKAAAAKAADARQRAEAAFRELQSSSAAAERDDAMWASSTNMATD